MKSKVYLSLVSVLFSLTAGSAVYAQSYGEMATIRPEDEAFLEEALNQVAPEPKIVKTTVVVPEPEVKVKPRVRAAQAPIAPQLVEKEFVPAARPNNNPRQAVKSSATIDVPSVESSPEGALEPYYEFYPTKEQIKETRAAGKVWYDADNRLDEIEPKIAVAEDGRVQRYKDAIFACLGDKTQQLGLEQAMLYKKSVYDGAAYITQTFEQINGCYEEIGFGIINDFYNGDEEMALKFQQQASEYYVKGTDVGFDTKFCDGDCSLKAMTMLQMDKFADFRVYLTKLLENRPRGH